VTHVSAFGLCINLQLALFLHLRPSTTRKPSAVGRDSSTNMSKRHRPSSPDPPTKTTRVSQTTEPFICELPPTCNKHPTTLGSGRELEAHYSTCHAHVCSVEGCNRVFPEPRFLDLVCPSSSARSASQVTHAYQHQTECHNPIADVKKDRGERIVSGSSRCVYLLDLMP
jgi:hypothetical protein